MPNITTQLISGLQLASSIETFITQIHFNPNGQMKPYILGIAIILVASLSKISLCQTEQWEDSYLFKSTDVTFKININRIREHYKRTRYEEAIANYLERIQKLKLDDLTEYQVILDGSKEIIGADEIAAIKLVFNSPKKIDKALIEGVTGEELEERDYRGVKIFAGAGERKWGGFAASDQVAILATERKAKQMIDSLQGMADYTEWYKKLDKDADLCITLKRGKDELRFLEPATAFPNINEAFEGHISGVIFLNFTSDELLKGSFQFDSHNHAKNMVALLERQIEDLTEDIERSIDRMADRDRSGNRLNQFKVILTVLKNVSFRVDKNKVLVTVARDGGFPEFFGTWVDFVFGVPDEFESEKKLRGKTGNDKLLPSPK